jgi:hypothetical protein
MKLILCLSIRPWRQNSMHFRHRHYTDHEWLSSNSGLFTPKKHPRNLVDRTLDELRSRYGRGGKETNHDFAGIKPRSSYRTDQPARHRHLGTEALVWMHSKAVRLRAAQIKFVWPALGISRLVRQTYTDVTEKVNDPKLSWNWRVQNDLVQPLHTNRLPTNGIPKRVLEYKVLRDPGRSKET